MEWEKYIVGFVDIMGQKDKLDELDSLLWEVWDLHNVSNEKSKKIAQLTGETYKEVEHFRQLFTDTFDNMKNSIFNNPNIGTLSPGEQAVMRILANDICKSQSFSDLIVFYAPFDAKDELLTLARISAMLSAYTCVSILEFRAGTFFRGGIEIGAGIELSDGDLYGPVLNNVHQLEEKVANYPRVVIGKRLDNFIHSEGQPVDIEYFPNSALANARDICKGLVCQDNDGQIIVDYLGEKAVELCRFPGSEALSFVKEGMAKVEDELNEHKKKGDPKLIKYHERLLAYYQSRIKYWDN